VELSKFIKKLQALEAEHGGNLEVFYVEGSSGGSGELSNPFFDDDAPAKGHNAGPLCEYKPGRPYIWIYAGN
jgi:hypothetical protein